MTLTLATFRETLRWNLKDATIWRDSMLNGWIKDAIRDYSNHFPMETSLKIDCTAATREYSLSAAGEVLGIISVEYPDGETSPRYLQRMAETHAIFWDGAYYDIRQGSTQYLVIGESPASTEDIILRYLTLHTIPSSDATTLTIPDEHFEAIRLYVYWQALRHIALDQDIDVGRKANIMTTLGGTAKDAEYAYHYKLRSYQGPAPFTGMTGPWHMDADDRIY